jgi:hypothetical protein
MLVSLTKTTVAATFAVGLALAGAVVSPADAAMRQGGGGSHGGGSHGGIQHGNSRDGGHRGHGGGYGGYAGGYGGYRGGCPLSPVGLITGYYC